jgi:hypothetical protein
VLAHRPFQGRDLVFQGPLGGEPRIGSGVRWDAAIGLLANGQAVFFDALNPGVVPLQGVQVRIAGKEISARVPLSLLPPWVQAIARWLPFRSMLGDPVAIWIGRVPSETEALRLVAQQWAWAAAMLLLASWLWRRGVRRYEAFGG